MPEQQLQLPNLPIVGEGMARLLCKIFGEEVGVPTEDYINLTDEEKLYALRCVADTPPQDCVAHGAFIGIAKRALLSLHQDGFLRLEGEIIPVYRLAQKGKVFLAARGGRFRHG